VSTELWVLIGFQCAALLIYFAITAWGYKLQREYRRLVEQPMVCERCGAMDDKENP
jgi:hypothetical protein